MSIFIHPFHPLIKKPFIQRFMKPIILRQYLPSVLLLAAILLNASCQVKNAREGCERFRNGKFIFKLKGQPFPVNFLIERKDSLQYETETISGKTSKLSVKWTGNCSYEMKMLETSFNLPDSIQRIRRTVPFNTEIISWTKEYYIFKSARGNAPALTDTMWISE